MVDYTEHLAEITKLSHGFNNDGQNMLIRIDKLELKPGSGFI